MKYVIRYKDKNTEGKISLRLPSPSLPSDKFVIKLRHFIKLVDELNVTFKKQGITTERSIEK